METTTAPLPWILRKTGKRFVCFYTYRGEIAKTEALPGPVILDMLKLSYEEYTLITKWMEHAGAGDIYTATPKAVVVCVKGRRTKGG